MNLKNVLTLFVCVPVACLFMVACNENESTDSPLPVEDVSQGSTSIEIKSFSAPASTTVDEEEALQLEISAVTNDAAVLYRFLPDSSGVHFKPNSGVMAGNLESARLLTRYRAPSEAGKYNYSVEFYTQDGSIKLHEFSIDVIN